MMQYTKTLAGAAMFLGTFVFAASGESTFEEAETFWGPVDCSTAVGNGSLTVSVNRFGRITRFCWPSPGYHDQISYCTRSTEPSAPASDGVMWGIRLGDKTYWPVAEPWHTQQRHLGPDSTAVRTLTTLAEPSLNVSQTLFVPISSNVLASRVLIERGGEPLDEPPQLIWYANFTPCTRLLPELPFGDWALDSTNDFAVFADSGKNRVCHFRPAAPDSVDWELAGRLIEEHANPSLWTGFDEGVWLLYGAAEEMTAFQCGRENDESSAFTQADQGVLSGNPAAAGACNSAVSIRPDEVRPGMYTATVFAAIGKDYGEASGALDQAMEQGFDALLEETDRYWKDWLERAEIPGNPDPEVVALTKRCLLTVATATDIYSRAIVRAPVSQPPLALDWPRHGVWATHALDSAGFHGLAEDHALFYLDAFRGARQTNARSGLADRPTGSLPAALYANGVEAVPSMLLEPEAAAWTLLSFWQHTGFLPRGARAAFLESVWDTVNLSADFLAGWADGATGAPLYSFSWKQLKDTRDPELTLATFVGLKSAVRIAKSLGQERPEWERRLQELAPILVRECLDPDGNWRVSDPLNYWIAELGPLKRPLLHAAGEGAEGLSDLHGVDAARTLYCLSMIWRERPEEIAELAAGLKPALKRSLSIPDEAPALGAAFPDALAASYAYLATRNLLTYRGWGKPPGGVQ